MTNPATDSDLTAMLHGRAASVRPHAPALTTIAARSRRLRRRRTAVASAGAATAASLAVVAGTIAVRPSNDGHDATVDVSAPLTPQASVTAPSTTPPPPLTGPPLRMGLTIADAHVTSVSDNVGVEPADMPPGVRVDYEDDAGARHLSITTYTASEAPGDLRPASDFPGSGVERTVDLGEGVEGTLTTIDPVPGGTGPAISIEAVQDGAHLFVDGVGLSEDELLSVARSVVISQAGAHFDAPGVPSDLVPGRPGSPFVGGRGVRTQVVYRTADATEIVVDVYDDDGGALFERDLEVARAEPTDALFELSVRGRAAVVRRFPDLAGPANGEVVTVTWREATGHLVAVRLTPPTNTVADPTIVASTSQPLSEAEFQALLAAHGNP